MNLHELFERTTQDMPESRRKDVKTAVNVLAKALSYPTARECPEEAYRLPLDHIYRVVEKALAGKGPHTIRNAKNNLSRLFRTADERSLFSLAPIHEHKLLYVHSLIPKRPSNGLVRRDAYQLLLADFPSALKEAWDKFYAWGTAPLVAGRPAHQRKRPISMTRYLYLWQSFFGYLHHIRHTPLSDLRYDLLFDFSLITAHLNWFINERYKQTTITCFTFLNCHVAMVNQYQPVPELREQLIAFRRTLPKPHPTYDKKDAWVPLATLDQIGQALWPTKQPKDIIQPPKRNPDARGFRSNGTHTARRAGLSLMLRLWCRRPYRQRNMREMKLGENLYQNASGQWVIRFQGKQLKVAEKKGKTNTFELPFPTDLVPQLQSYLNTWRPLLAQRVGETKHVFLNFQGNPYDIQSLYYAVRECVYSYTKVFFHPHAIRTIWATDYIRKTGDFYGAAVMLNDTLPVVIEKYSHVMEHGVAEKADKWVNGQLNGQAVTTSDILHPTPTTQENHHAEAR